MADYRFTPIKEEEISPPKGGDISLGAGRLSEERIQALSEMDLPEYLKEKFEKGITFETSEEKKDYNFAPTSKEESKKLKKGNISLLYDIHPNVAPPEHRKNIIEYGTAKYNRGIDNLVRLGYGRAAMRGEISDEEAISKANKERLRQLKEDGELEEATLTEHPVRFAFGEAAEMVPFMAGAMRESARYAMEFGMAAGAAAFVGGQLGPQALTPEEIVTVPSATAGGMAVGAYYGPIKYSMDYEGGGIYLDLIEGGVNNKIARPIALAGGLAIGIIEVAKLKLLGGAMKKAIMKKVTSKGAKNFMVKAMGRYLRTWGGEVAQEEAQEIVTIASETLAGMIDENPDVVPTPEEISTRMVEIAKRAGAGMAVIALPGGVVDVSTSLKQAGQQVRTQRRLRQKFAKHFAEKGLTEEEINLLIMPEEAQEGKIKEIEQKIGEEQAREIEKRAMPETAEEKVARMFETQSIEILAEQSFTKATINKMTHEQRRMLAEEKIKNAEDKKHIENIKKKYEIEADEAAEQELEEFFEARVKKKKEGIEVPEERTEAYQDALEQYYKGGMEAAKEAVNLFADIKELGGIKPSAFLVEEMEVIPFYLKNKKGQALDEIVQELNSEYGWGFKNAEDLRLTIEETTRERKEGKYEAPLSPLERKLKNIENEYKRKTTVTKHQIKTIQEEVIKELEDSDLSAKDRAKFIRTIKNIQTKRQLNIRLPEIRDRIAKWMEKSRIRETKAKIKKELKTTKIRKQAGKPAGKYPPHIQAYLDNMREATKLTQEQARQKLQRNLEKYEDEMPPTEITLENRVLSLASQGSQEMQELLNEIRSIKEEGRASKEVDGILRKEQIEEWTNKAVDVITGGEGITETKTIGVEEVGLKDRIVRTLGKSIVGWNDLLDMMSYLDKESAPGESWLNKFGDVFDEQLNEITGMKDTHLAITGMAMESFGFDKESTLFKKFHKDQIKKTLGLFENAAGEKVEFRLSLAEARKRWMELQDPSLREVFFHEKGMAYTKEIENAINDFLTEEDKDFARKQLKFYRDYYPEVNNVYKQTYGANLPFNDYYSPIRRETFDIAQLEGTTELLQEVRYRTSVASGSLKSRIANFHKIKEQSDISALQQHISDMEHFMAWAQKIRELKSVFGNRKVKRAIKKYYGKDAQKKLDGFLEDFTRGGIQRAGRIKGFEAWRVKFSRSVLALKPSIGIKQLTSFVAYADSIPVKHFTAGVIDFWKNPIKNAKILLATDYMQQRGPTMTRDMQRVMKTEEYNSFKKNPTGWNQLMLNVQLGDKGAIITGGWSVYRYFKDIKGLSHNEAVRKFTTITNETQQSAYLSELSALQRGGPTGKLISQFASAPNMFLRKELRAIRGLASGRGSRMQHIKTLIIYHMVIPTLFQWVANFFDWDEKEQLISVILGPLSGAFIVGSMLEGSIKALLGAKSWPARVPLFGLSDDMKKAGDAINDLATEGFDTEDLMRAIDGILAVTGAATGTPLEPALTEIESIWEFLDGKYERGLGKLLGWSDYILDRRDEKVDDWL